MLLELTPYFAAAVPLVIALVEIFKLYVDSKWAPLASLGIGVIVSWLMVGTLLSSETILQGILIGLSASGLFTGARKMFA